MVSIKEEALDVSCRKFCLMLRDFGFVIATTLTTHRKTQT
jgi:hypothetical protein